MNPECPRCGSISLLDAGWQISCRECKASTKCYVGRLGESGREIEQACWDWNSGDLQEVQP